MGRAGNADPLPCSSRTETVGSKMPPAASATPSTACTCSSTPASKAGGRAPRESSIVSFVLMLTSTPLFDSEKMSSNELLTESVSINVPAIMATPKKTARAVRNPRILRATTPRTVRANIAYSICIRASTSSADCTRPSWVTTPSARTMTRSA